MAKTNIVFSASSFDLWEWCEQKYQYAHLMRKGLPAHEKPIALDRGTLGHIGMDSYFNGIAQGIHFNDRMHTALFKIKEEAADPAKSAIDISEELPIVLKAFEESCQHWRFQDEHMEILAVETPFDYILYEDDYVRIIISGKVDLLVNLPAIGGGASYTNLPLDHKFVTRDFPVDELNNQFINYCIPTGSHHLVVNKVGLQKTLKPEEKYKRYPLSYDDTIIQEWKDNVTGVILNRYLPAYMQQKFYRRMPNCRKFGRLCEFYNVCKSSGEDAKKFKLEAMYVERPAWDKYAEGEDEV